MALYESTFILRHELSDKDVEKVIGDFEKVVTDAGGKVVKRENWGLRTLAYKINKSRKGHYVYLGLDTPGEAISEITRKSRLHEDVMRNLTIKVEELPSGPTSIMKQNEAA